MEKAKRVKQARPARRERVPVGWREYVGLPDLDVRRIKAKIDTGARTSALHVTDLETFRRRGETWLRFTVHPRQRSAAGSSVGEARLLEFRRVRSSDGRSQRRPVIETTLRLGREERKIRLTLASRDLMGFRMLLGREALRGHAVVDPGASFLVSGRKGRRAGAPEPAGGRGASIRPRRRTYEERKRDS